MKVSIKTNIFITFLLLVGIVALSLLFSQYYFSEKLAIESTNKTFRIISKNISEHILNEASDTRKVLSLKSKHKKLYAPITFEPIHPFFDDMVLILQQNHHLHAIYFAHPDGSFYEVIHMQGRTALYQTFKAPPSTCWTIVTIIDNQQQNAFLDKNFNLITKNSFSKTYAVSERPWYSNAMKTTEIISTLPYFFSNSQKMGITYAKKISPEGIVLALDYTMHQLNELLALQEFDVNSEVFVVDKKGNKFASSLFSKEGAQQKAQTIHQELKQAFANKKTNQVIKYQEEGKNYFALFTPLLAKDRFLGIKLDSETLLKPYRESIRYAFLIAFILLLLSIPVIFFMTNRIVKPIKDLILENEKIKERNYPEVKAIETNIIEFDMLSASQVSMSKSIQAYEQSQEALLDGFIRVIAEAIDTKSPYTGKHCERVPEIAQLLLDAANNSQEGPFQSFSLTSKEALREFEIGAWLHDCGKVTTPEYVVDKSTKLETIYNRIHEIRMRFELLWRDAHILYLQDEILLEEMHAKQAQLRDDFAFIASCNLGSEFMEQSKQERIKSIAKITWQRYFDDSLGLGPIESQRQAQENKQALPVTENLLNNKEQHIVPRENFDHENYREEGFTLEVPEHLYNYGEIYNLCIEKGTLSKEERYKIQEHVIMSIKMLEQIPFPAQLSNIPEYAGTHHETLIGTGYPKKLSKKDLSIPARIMAIADIFEALTASDRPYKKAKTLSESIRIMSYMVKEKHIDPDLFQLFLRSRVYKIYAQRHLQEEQIDEVNIQDYL